MISVCLLVTDVRRMGVWQHSQPNSASSFTTRRCTVSLKRQCLLFNVQSHTLLMLILVVLLKNLDVGRHRGLTRRDATQQTTTAAVCCHSMRAVQHQVLKLMSQPPAPLPSATVVSTGSIQHLYSSLMLSFSSSHPFSSFHPPLILSSVFPPLPFSILILLLLLSISIAFLSNSFFCSLTSLF